MVSFAISVLYFCRVYIVKRACARLVLMSQNLSFPQSRSILFALVTLLGCAAVTAVSNDAFIILRKTLHSEYPGVLAQGTNFTVQLDAINVGKTYVSLAEICFPPYFL